MAVPPRTATEGTFFLTAITANRRRLFQVETNARLLLDTLQHHRRRGLYKRYAFVVMPDHRHPPPAPLHLRPPQGHAIHYIAEELRGSLASGSKAVGK